MSWMKTLCETYDQNADKVADFSRKDFICPIAHMTASSQIQITIDIDGIFHGAEAVTDKNDAEIIIPVTDESAGRASGIAPHPLCDNLTYVAGDYSEYAGTKKDAETAAARFDEYLKGLEQWEKSSFSCDKIRGVFRYAAGKTMIKDLVRSGIVELDGSGKLSGEKIAGKSYDKCIVRFRVLGSDTPEECWLDKSLMDIYQAYYCERRKESSRLDICYLTGECDVISDNHPKGILPSSYGAKLISANDNTDFTFRGRFKTGEEAYAVSYEATQKAHNALKWLAKIQGYTVGVQDKRTYICWNIGGKDVAWIDDPFGYGPDENADHPSTMPEYKRKLENLINGYKDEFDETDDIALMALEAATTGRLSIVYYNELKAMDYLERIRNWNDTCCWQFTTFNSDISPRKEVMTPAIKRIVEYCFGVEQEDGYIRVSDKLLIMQYQRLFHCIVDKQRIPRDFVEAIFRKASHLQNYRRLGNRERLLSTACALIVKFYNDKDEEKIEMEVDRTLADRDYLYGRLLAVYEKIEKSTYKKDEGRETNAIRLQTIYSQHPATTRVTLEHAINPYFKHLSYGLSEYFRNEIEEISNMIGMRDEKELNRPLGYKYLIGYWAERAYLNTKKEKKDEEE